MRLFVEMRRRGVLKVAIGYLGISWLTLEIGHTLFLIFDLPHAGLQLIFALLVLGFPLALFATWNGWLGAGIAAEPATAPGAGPARHAEGHENAWHAAIFGLLVVVVIAIAIAIRFFGMSTHSHAEAAPAAAGAPPSAEPFAPPPHSVAVLPFVNMSGDPRQDYFSDGLSEELLDSLARIRDLQVAARTSSFTFKGKDSKVSDIAHELNVGAVLEGSVRRDGNHVRITVQLINAVSGFHLWSETYDRDLKSILALQTEIATAVTKALQATLLADAGAIVEPGGTQVPAAFDAYLKGKSLTRLEMSRDTNEGRIAAFEEAIRLDPGYAKAYVGLAIAQTSYANNFATQKDQRARYEKARTAAEVALKLAPELGEVHLAQATVLQNGWLDYARALPEYERAVALSPNDPYVLTHAGWFLTQLGRADAGIAYARRGVEIDQLNGSAYRFLGYTLQAAHRHREAIEAFGRALRLNPSDQSAAASRGLSQIVLGNVDGAIASCELPNLGWSARTCLAIAYDKAHRSREAREQLEAMQREMGDSCDFQMAEIHAQWGDRQSALHWLERAYELSDPGLNSLHTDEFLDPLRQETRFLAIERKLRLPP